MSRGEKSKIADLVSLRNRLPTDRADGAPASSLATHNLTARRLRLSTDVTVTIVVENMQEVIPASRGTANTTSAIIPEVVNFSKWAVVPLDALSTCASPADPIFTEVVNTPSPAFLGFPGGFPDDNKLRNHWKQHRFAINAGDFAHLQKHLSRDRVEINATKEHKARVPVVWDILDEKAADVIG
jgi:hypothetical protein